MLEHYKVVEFDKYAIKSYNAIHNTDFPTMDITQISGSDLGIVDTLNYCYIMTYSFPCQDLSVAGKQAGMSKGSGTRSGLLWEVERLLNEVKNLPQVLLMENVPQVHGKKNMQDFQKWIDFLESKGYSNYWQDLNAKNYGIAQNRNRTFMVSILGNYKYEFPKPIELQKVMKDYLEDEVDEKYYIQNEKAQKLIEQLISNGTIPSRAEQSRLALTCQSTDQKDAKSQTVSRQDMMQELAISKQMEPVLLKGMIDKQLQPTATKQEVATTLLARDYKGLNNFGTNGVIMEVERIANLFGNDKGTGFAGNIWDKQKLSPTITTMQGGYREPMIIDSQIVAMRGRNPDNPSDRTVGSPTEQRLEPNSQGICNTLTSVQKDNLVLEQNPIGSLYYGASESFGCGYMDNCYKTVKAEKDDLGVIESVCAIDEQNMNVRNETFRTLTTDGSSPKHNNRVMEYTETQYRIRKLTPMECWRLMDFTDEDFHKAEEVNSNTQLYKQAGNSICKNVLVAIFGQMLDGKEDVYKEINSTHFPNQQQ